MLAAVDDCEGAAELAIRGRSEIQISNLRALLVSFAMVGVGLAMIYLSTTVGTARAALSSILSNVGGAVLTTGGISIIWDLVSKRAFLSEIFSVARLSEDVENSGLCRITTDFNHDMEWPSLLEGAKRIDVFVAYARTWRRANARSLQTFAARSGNDLTLILPDPDNDSLMGELARRFEADVKTMRDRINEAKDEFIKLFTAEGAKAKLKIWLVQTAPVFSFYRIDNRYVIAMYRHRPGRGDIPTLVCDRRGDLTKFIDDEIEALTDAELVWTRCVYPPAKAKASIPLPPPA